MPQLPEIKHEWKFDSPAPHPLTIVVRFFSNSWAFDYKLHIVVDGLQHPCIDESAGSTYHGDESKNPALMPVMKYIANGIEMRLALSLKHRGMNQSVSDDSQLFQNYSMGSKHIELMLNPQASYIQEHPEAKRVSDEVLLGLVDDIKEAIDRGVPGIKRLLAASAGHQPDRENIATSIAAQTEYDSAFRDKLKQIPEQTWKDETQPPSGGYQGRG